MDDKSANGFENYPKQENQQTNLTKEKYLELKTHGLSDAKIIKNYYMPVAAFYELKREWGLVGVKLDQTTPVTSVTSAPPEPAQPEPVPSTPAPAFNPDNLTWMTPRTYTTSKMILKIRADKIILNAAATKTLAPAKVVKIGADKQGGVLAIAPTTDDAVGYKLPNSKQYSHVGGKNLVDFLTTAGFERGIYELNLHDGYLLARKEGRVDA